jgi:hypothetical protein
MTVYNYITNEMRLAKITELNACNGSIKNECILKVSFYENLLKILPIAALNLNIVNKPFPEIPSENKVMFSGKIRPVSFDKYDGHGNLYLDGK